MRNITSKLTSAFNKVTLLASGLINPHQVSTQESKLDLNLLSLNRFIKSNAVKAQITSLKAQGCTVEGLNPISSHTPIHLSLHSSGADHSVYIEISEPAVMRDGKVVLFIGVDDGDEVFGVDWEPTEAEMATSLLAHVPSIATSKLSEFVSSAYQLKALITTVEPSEK